MTAEQAPLDAPKALRDEDAFDTAAVTAWLREHAPLELPDGLPTVRQFPGGASNLTYQLDWDTPAGAEPVTLILRRPPAGQKARGAHDMHREYDVQAALAPVFPYVPKMLAFCDDASITGGDFYVMERLRGTILRGKGAERLLVDPQLTRAVCESAWDRLVDLHGVDVHAAGLDQYGRGEGYVRRQVNGWSERYTKAHTWNVPSFQKVMAWLDREQPADNPSVLIHNDFRLDNLVLDPADLTRVLGVLDWEMATIGDPLMDLGGAMAYWVQADDGRGMKLLKRQPSDLPGMLTRQQIVQRYAQRTGLSVDAWAFYEVFGLFRLAAIMQQIYFRYHHKQTRNPAFKNFWLVVHVLDRRCQRIIKAS